MSLFTSLLNSAGALGVYDRALSVVQNNVANASTPGFAKQRQTLEAMAFEPAMGYPGGIEAGAVVSYRDAYAERAVRRQNEFLGFSSQKASDLEQIEPAFNIAGGAGVPESLSALFEAFSVLAVSPNNLAARSRVLDRAAGAAASFHQTAAALAAAGGAEDQQIRSTAGRINELAAQVRDINIERRNNFRTAEAPGVDAKLHVILDELAGLADFTAIEAEDRTTTLLLGGQIPLVMGVRQFEIQADFSSPETRILNPEGKDITGVVTRGSLAALLEVKNQLLPSYLADLNRLAETVADRVNSVLAGGLDLYGSPPANHLFSYDSTAGAAATLAAAPLDPAELAAAGADAPGGNANALLLGELGTSKEIDGLTFVEYYGALAGRMGNDLARAREDGEIQAELAEQARSLREAVSGVSLDEEAAYLIQFQRAYQAVARMVTVLDELTKTVIQMV